MKRYIQFPAMAIVALASALSLTSCGDDDPEVTPGRQETGGGSTPTTTVTKLSISSYGSSESDDKTQYVPFFYLSESDTVKLASVEVLYGEYSDVETAVENTSYSSLFSAQAKADAEKPLRYTSQIDKNKLGDNLYASYVVAAKYKDGTTRYSSQINLFSWTVNLSGIYVKSSATSMQGTSPVVTFSLGHATGISDVTVYYGQTDYVKYGYDSQTLPKRLKQAEITHTGEKYAAVIDTTGMNMKNISYWTIVTEEDGLHGLKPVQICSGDYNQYVETIISDSTMTETECIYHVHGLIPENERHECTHVATVLNDYVQHGEGDPIFEVNADGTFQFELTLKRSDTDRTYRLAYGNYNAASDSWTRGITEEPGKYVHFYIPALGN